MKLEKIDFRHNAIDNFVLSEFLTQKGAIVVLFSFLFLFQNAFGQKVNAIVDTTEIRIGEEILYTINVEADSTDVVLFPEAQSFGALEIIESYKVDTTFKATKYRLIKKYGLTQFDSGHYTIPPQHVNINNQLFATDSINVEVRNVVVDTLQQKMFAIKPPVKVKNPPFDWVKLLTWLIPILLLAGLIYYFIRRRKQKKEAEKQLPPYEEAIVALQKLDNSQLLKENKSKEYYSSLTEIVKRYLDREVDETALESTSDELINRLMMHKQAGSFDFDHETIRKLDQIFKRADLVKFARMNQQASQAEFDRKTVEEIINETKEVIPEPTEEELMEDREHLEKLKRKRQRRKWAYSIAGIFLGLILMGAVYGSFTGFDNLKDKILGNELRSLAESQWIKSEYGHPSVVLETPKVLMRVNETDGAENQLISGKDVFSYADMKSPLYVMVSTFQFNRDEELDLDNALDALLNDMEDEGAKNLLVKRDDFETGQGITGVRAFGEFNLQVAENRVLKKTSSYELLLFAQQGGLQEVLIVYQDDDKYAKEIVERIVKSIELELTTGR